MERVGTLVGTPEEENERRREIWANARGWVEDESGFLNVAGPESRVVSLTDLRHSLITEHNNTSIQHPWFAVEAYH